LSTFEAQPLSDDDGKLNNFDQEEDAAFNIKYLTSSKLMGLEVNFGAAGCSIIDTVNCCHNSQLT
jgi:hypothetical protein